MENQGPALAVTLNGREREVAQEVQLAELNHAEGIKKLMDKLEKTVDVNTLNKSYQAYVQFETACRTSDLSVFEYILEFERLYGRVLKQKMTLSSVLDKLKALRLSPHVLR